MSMTNRDIIKALNRIAIYGGSYPCSGCGYEHNCRSCGCRVIRAAAERLEAYAKTGLTPDICAEYKKFEDECIEKGVPFYRILELMNAETEGRIKIIEQAPEIKKEEV